MKIDQNKGSEQILALLEGVEGDLGDDIDELMNDSDTEFVFEKEDSEEDDVSDYQRKNILIREAGIHVINPIQDGGSKRPLLPVFPL